MLANKTRPTLSACSIKSRLGQWLPASRDVDAYFLGPQPFMRAVKQYLRELGVPEQQTHHEFFGPAAALN